MNSKLPGSFDAQDWVREWLETIKKNPSIPTDEGTMLGWFANAIMAGWDEHKRRHTDAPSALTASEARVQRLEMALQNCIREMSWALDKKVGGPVMDGGLFEQVRNQARSALGDVPATKGENRE